ncbi:MAG TPA: DUF5666 domain-containing protein [Vicinamibacterales bacterium]|jgi:hypothetical protein|nr:DUF5666 domain-containing protein [Vicinamibacterales bacterium]
MRRTFVALALGALAVAGWPTRPAFAQDTKTARGTVTAMAADSISVKVQGVDMKFVVDTKTTVEARGAGTKSRAAQRAGMPGPKLADVVKVGEAVEVSYHDMSGTFHAARIRAVANPGPSSPAEAASKTSNGTVKSVTATSLSISGSGGGGATFDQTFTIDSKTKVVGKGAGTASAAKGGKIAITDLVAMGDRVSVSFHDMNGTLHASEVRVTTKAAAAK